MNGWALKVSDKFRCIGGEFEGSEAVLFRAIDFVGTEVIVYTTAYADGSTSQRGMNRLRFEERFEPAPEVFESNTVYRRADNGVIVECLYADETVAVIKNEGGAKYLRNQDSRADYVEVCSWTGGE